ncbi:MAG TPA: glycosyltransferase family 2 protein [Bryobacteraceae bacterium]|jgi:glycosyltransferase involved in cell wall biosynthesis
MISIIIPCRNERHSIGRALDSLAAQECPDAWEIIVADGMSDDGTRAVLAEYCGNESRIRTIDNPARSVSAGLNIAIQQALGDIILRMDAHTEYAPDYVAQCVRALENSGADNVGGPARTRSEGIVQSAIAAAYHSPLSTGGARFHDASYEGYVDTVPYGCWRKTTLERIGLFDESLVRNQDDELNLRLIRAGGKIWQSSKIVSWYRPRASFAALFRQYFQYGFWKGEVIRKHRIPASWRHLVPGTFVLANIALLIASAAGSRLMLEVWLLCIALYGAACLAASVRAAQQNGWKLLPLLPFAFATFHVSYGLGFLAHVFHQAIRRPGPPQPSRLFTSLTR